MIEQYLEPIVVINLISMPAAAADVFVEAWPANSARLRDAPGFRGTRLLRALSPDDPYQVVNVAQWDSVEQWRAALSAVQSDSDRRRQAETTGMEPRHFFYRVVSVTPDPLERPADA